MIMCSMISLAKLLCRVGIHKYKLTKLNDQEGWKKRLDLDMVILGDRCTRCGRETFNGYVTWLNYHAKAWD